jgi:hypothetical protein
MIITRLGQHGSLGASCMIKYHINIEFRKLLWSFIHAGALYAINRELLTELLNSFKM